MECELGTMTDQNAGISFFVKCRSEGIHQLYQNVTVLQGNDLVISVRVCDQHISSITGWH